MEGILQVNVQADSYEFELLTIKLAVVHQCWDCSYSTSDPLESLAHTCASECRPSEFKIGQDGRSNQNDLPFAPKESSFRSVYDESCWPTESESNTYEIDNTKDHHEGSTYHYLRNLIYSC